MISIKLNDVRVCPKPDNMQKHSTITTLVAENPYRRIHAEDGKLFVLVHGVPTEVQFVA